MNTGLVHGPLSGAICHVAVDMQVYFAENSEWASPATLAILPMVERLAAHAPARTIFTRFMPPHAEAHATGQWQTYYRRWASVLGQNNDPAIYDLLPPLRRFVPPAHVVDKPTYSAFEAPGFLETLARLGCETVILSGVETDVCVLATALTAVDRGIRVILATDAMASGSAEGHDRILDTLVPRYDRQIETASCSTILERWTP
jgi:nicotinamidase-related amidase